MGKYYELDMFKERDLWIMRRLDAEKKGGIDYYEDGWNVQEGSQISELEDERQFIKLMLD